MCVLSVLFTRLDESRLDHTREEAPPALLPVQRAVPSASPMALASPAETAQPPQHLGSPRSSPMASRGLLASGLPGCPSRGSQVEHSVPAVFSLTNTSPSPSGDEKHASHTKYM